MPNIDAGVKQDREDRTSGELRVVFQAVADRIIEGKDGRPPALKVVFKSTVSDSTANYAIPIGQENADEAKARVNPFTDGEPTSFTEAGLRTFIEANVKPGPYLVKTWGDYIQAFKADVGEHDGYLVDMRMTKKGDRIWFTMRDEDGFESDFPAPYYAEHKKGAEPYLDTIGGRDPENPDVQLFAPNKGAYYYLANFFGLDWERFALEGGELASAPALWPGHFDNEGIPMEPYLKLGQGFPPPHDSWCYFGDINDPTPELLDATRRHGLKPVSWEVVETAKYGIGVKRGDFFFELTPIKIKVMGGVPTRPDNKEKEAFREELSRFMELYDNLTKVVMADEEAVFLEEKADGSIGPSDAGRKVAVSVIVPLVQAHPDAVLVRKKDGSPGTQIPPDMETWTLDGLVSANRTAEMLFKLGSEALTDPFGIVNANDHEKLLAWAKTAVPEWVGAGKDDKGELL